jgi:hypothetical protein
MVAPKDALTEMAKKSRPKGGFFMDLLSFSNYFFCSSRIF